MVPSSLSLFFVLSSVVSGSAILSSASSSLLSMAAVSPASRPLKCRECLCCDVVVVVVKSNLEPPNSAAVSSSTCVSVVSMSTEFIFCSMLFSVMVYVFVVGPERTRKQQVLGDMSVSERSRNGVLSAGQEL